MNCTSQSTEKHPSEILCRICMTTNDTEVVYIYSRSDSKYHGIDKKIEDCTSLEISQDDGLPGTVCLSCATKIIEWYEFKILAKLSYERLRRITAIKQENDVEFVEVNVDIVCEKDDENNTSSEDENVPLSQLQKLKLSPNLAFQKKKPSIRKDHKLKVKPYCNLCGVKFIRVSELSEHCQSEHNISTSSEQQILGTNSEQFVVFRCHLCQKEFENRRSLRDHCREQHQVKVIHPYGCSHCHRQFPSWGLLVVHERQHTGKKPYSCDICSKDSFVSPASLRRHKLMHEKAYSCKDCEKHFNCDSALKAHIRCKHTNEKPYLCNICGRSFSLVAILNAHMTSHSSERKYKCEICGFRSKTSGNHHRHRARHNKTDGKTFKCPICGKAFETKIKLSSHIVIHKSQRPHVCKLCGKGFIYKNKLETHILLVHAKERPYPCHICGRKLASKFGLGIHLKTHIKNDGDIVTFEICEESKVYEPVPILVDMPTPILTVSNNDNLILEEVKAGLLSYKQTS